MKRSSLFFLALVLPLLLSSCERNFDELLVKARQAFEEKNYTVVIDRLVIALSRWKEKNGIENKAEAYELLGKSYHALNKLDQAADAYRMAVKLSKNRYDSAYTLGVIYTASFQHKNAQAAFQEALRMRNNDPLALVGLGDSLFSMGKYEEAKTIYKKVIEVSPGVPEALKNLELVSQKLASKKEIANHLNSPRSRMKILRKKH